MNHLRHRVVWLRDALVGGDHICENLHNANPPGVLTHRIGASEFDWVGRAPSLYMTPAARSLKSRDQGAGMRTNISDLVIEVVKGRWQCCRGSDAMSL